MIYQPGEGEPILAEPKVEGQVTVPEVVNATLSSDGRGETDKVEAVPLSDNDKFFFPKEVRAAYGDNYVDRVMTWARKPENVEKRQAMHTLLTQISGAKEIPPAVGRILAYLKEEQGMTADEMHMLIDAGLLTPETKFEDL